LQVSQILAVLQVATLTAAASDISAAADADVDMQTSLLSVICFVVVCCIVERCYQTWMHALEQVSFLSMLLTLMQR
jgi:hypothetical protein